MNRQNDSNTEHKSSSKKHSHSHSHHSSSKHRHSSSHHSSHRSSGTHHSSEHHSSSHGSSSYTGSRRISRSDREKIDNLVSKYQVVENTGFVDTSVRKKRRRHRSRMHPALKALIIVLCVLLSVIIAISATFATLNILGRRQIDEVSQGVGDNKYSVTYDEGKTIVYNGQKYALNENIVTVAGIGVDREGFGLVNDKIGTGGQADTIIVVTLDLDSGKVSAIMIPRDSMVDVDQYTVSGSYVGVERMQICLSYAYGDGKTTSCENVISSIERLLYGIPINLYGVLELQGIPYLNDAIGGVTVEALETFDKFTAGQRFTLYGSDAVTYVRERNTEILNSDSLRRERQIQYIRAFAQKVASSAVRDFGIITDLYNTASEYSFTNVSLSKLTYLATTLLSKGISFDNIVSLKGELVDADPYPEYIVDEEAAFETVLSIFYTPVNE